MYKCILFDMDGTLVNTYEGIYNSYKYALEQMNLPFHGDSFVGKVIGAPLLSVFTEYFRLNEQISLQAVEYYRKYYSAKGKNEAVLYDGIDDILQQLKKHGYLLGVATLKRESFATEILNTLNIHKYFDIVCGIDENDSLSKTDLILKCIHILNVSNINTILVGDSEYDAKGAADANIDFLAVLYGFGFKDETSLKENPATFVAKSPYECLEFIQYTERKRHHNKL